MYIGMADKKYIKSQTSKLKKLFTLSEKITLQMAGLHNQLKAFQDEHNAHTNKIEPEVEKPVEKEKSKTKKPKLKLKEIVHDNNNEKVKYKKITTKSKDDKEKKNAAEYYN